MHSHDVWSSETLHILKYLWERTVLEQHWVLLEEGEGRGGEEGGEEGAKERRERREEGEEGGEVHSEPKALELVTTIPESAVSW